MISVSAKPLIILGMHRSGTSMIARMLESLGLYSGWLKDRNNESLFFLWINDWLMNKTGGSWSFPEPFMELLDHQELRKITVSYLHKYFRFPYIYAYLGPAMKMKYRSLSRISTPWGWKDPRNIYTLPLWLDLFPDAKVVHVCRHGVDVANSLLSRQMKEINLAKSTTRILQRRGRIIRGHWLNTGVLDLDSCFNLWENYNQQALTHTQRLAEKAFSIKYEDLLESPHEMIKALSEYCELNVSRSTIEAELKKLYPGRRFAYLKSKKLVDFADKNSERLSALGY